MSIAAFIAGTILLLTLSPLMVLVILLTFFNPRWSNPRAGWQF